MSTGAEKRWATARARLALQGWAGQCKTGEDGAPVFVATCGEIMAIRRTLADVEAFVTELEAAAAVERRERLHEEGLDDETARRAATFADEIERSTRALGGPP